MDDQTLNGTSYQETKSEDELTDQQMKLEDELTDDEDEKWLADQPFLVVSHPKKEPHQYSWFKNKYKVDQPLNEEEIVQEFEENISQSKIGLSDIQIEETQKLFEEEHKADAEIENELEDLRKFHLQLQQEKAKRDALDKKLKLVKEQSLREEWTREYFRRLGEESRLEFKRREDYAKLALQKMHGNLIWQKEASIDQRKWKITWNKEPQQVQIRICQLRAVKDKLPSGKYVMFVSLYNRLGGQPIKFSKEAGKFKKSTKKVRHKGRFIDISIVFDDTLSIMFPSKKEIQPRLCLVFELFCLKRKNYTVNKVVAWGVFPAIDNNLNIIEGCYKLPMIKGELDTSINKFCRYNNIARKRFKYWLANLYFETKVVNVTELDKFEFIMDIRGSDEPFFVNQQKMVSKDISDDDETEETEYEESEMTHVKMEESPKKEEKDKEEEFPKKEENIKQEDNKNEEEPKKEENTKQEDNQKKEEQKMEEREAYQEFIKKIIHDESPFKKEEINITIEDDEEDAKSEILERRSLLHEHKLTKPKPYSLMTMKSWFGKPKFGVKKLEDKSTDKPKKESLIDKLQIHPTKEKINLKLRRNVQKISIKKSLFDKPSDDDPNIDYHNYIQSVKKDELIWNKIPIYQKKLLYLTSTLLYDLGIDQIWKLRFWLMILLSIFVLWLRMFPHYIGQWILISMFRVPLIEQSWLPYLVILDYRDEFQSTLFNIVFVICGTIFNLIFFLFLVIITLIIQTKYICPNLPSIWYRSIFVYGMGVAFDPILIFIQETIFQHFRGEGYRLAIHFTYIEGSPILGICLTFILFLFLILFGIFCMYQYIIRVHENGKVLDVYRRQNIDNQSLFIPHDLEISLDELVILCNQSKKWRGPKGETRQVVLKIVPEDTVSLLFMERLLLLLDSEFPWEYCSKLKMNPLNKRIANDIIEQIPEMSQFGNISSEEEFHRKVLEYYWSISQNPTVSNSLDIQKPVVWLQTDPYPDINIERVQVLKKKFVILNFNLLVDCLCWEFEKPERTKMVKKFLYNFGIVPIKMDSDLNKGKRVVGVVHSKKEDNRQDTFLENLKSSFSRVFSSKKISAEKIPEDIQSAQHVIIYNFGLNGVKQFWRHFVQCPDGTICECFFSEENNVSYCNLLDKNHPDYWIHKATIQLEDEFT